MKVEKIIDWARHNKRFDKGIVLCGNCDNPALKSMALKMSWVGCGSCYFGEADAVDWNDVVLVQRRRTTTNDEACP